MQRLDCDICLQDIEEYYDTTVDIIDHNQRLLDMSMGNHHGAKLLSAGRVVILRDGVSKRRFVKNPSARTERLTEFPIPQHFKSNVGVLLKPGPARVSGEPRSYWVLAAVDSHTKDRKNGKAVNDNQLYSGSRSTTVVTIHPALLWPLSKPWRSFR